MLPFEAHSDMEAFVQSLIPPRRVVLLVPAGKPVDAALESLGKLLAKGDTVIDMGNEWYQRTEARQASMAELGIHYMGCARLRARPSARLLGAALCSCCGTPPPRARAACRPRRCGISGGESGARSGPCLMPSGSAAAWATVAPIFEAIAARTPDGPCVAFLGPGAAGNYVKMVHNGIEYADMQLIGEAYHLMRTVGGMSNAQVGAVFSRWSKGPLASYLVEITAAILATKDDLPAGGATEPGRERADLIDRIKDSCGSKGTGKWTVQEAAEQGVAAPTMSAALEARYLSSLAADRQRSAGRMPFFPAVATRRLFSPVLALARGVLGLACAWAPQLGRLGSRVVGWPLVASGPCLVDDLEDVRRAALEPQGGRRRSPEPARPPRLPVAHARTLPPSSALSAPAGPLLLQALLVRAGPLAHPERRARQGLGGAAARARAHLEGRLHHPRRHAR